MKYVICNLKNKLDKEKNKIVSNYLNSINHKGIKLIVMPSFCFFNIYDSTNYSLGSQDISSITDQTVTGEITGEQLASLGLKYVLVGHSERRIFKKEINIDFINKINNAQDNNINVVYCIGEKDKKSVKEELSQQLAEVLNNVSLRNIIIAYEPTWAIGSGTLPIADDIEKNIDFIKKYVFDNYEVKIDVIYGGSINKSNALNLQKIKCLDGFIIGTASLEPNELIEIIEQVAE